MSSVARGFQLVKLFGGSDGEATGYAVFVGDNVFADQCHCRGFLRHNHCTHCDGRRNSRRRPSSR
ncbi:hypothetical protein BH11PLA2_BH11PLA2_32590 [soil metagenome]